MLWSCNRLPIIQGMSFAFILPAIAILSQDKWKCPSSIPGLFTDCIVFTINLFTIAELLNYHVVAIRAVVDPAFHVWEDWFLLPYIDFHSNFISPSHYSILLERLSSCLGISSTALSWIKSYLLNRSFYVNIENSKSSVFQLLYGVPQGSALGSLLFILYTTPLSTVISNSSANHQLYADDTQLFLSFSALNFSHNIIHLENTITNVANRMSSNFLSLNPSKTEFLIFGLPQQFSKLNNLTIHLPNNVILSPADSARNLGVIFDKNMSFPQHIPSISKSCFLNIRDLWRIRKTIDQTTSCTIATSLIHSKIDYCNSSTQSICNTNESSSTCP